MRKIKVGILGATGMVGQRFICLLENHPWFEIVCIAASPSSAGKKYSEAVYNRWMLKTSIPRTVRKIKVMAVKEDFNTISKQVDLVFSALDLEKDKIKQIEERYANAAVAVVSNNSAHRWTEDVPMIIPEVNPDHVKLLKYQRRKRGWKGFIVVKPNCSIQSYVAILTALRHFNPKKIQVTSLQSISGAGKTFDSWPEMFNNVIPYIAKEEEKSEKEPMKIWGKISGEKIILAKRPLITATCIRVPTTDGHMASISVTFEKKLTKKEIVQSIRNFKNPLARLKLPSAPKQFIRYFNQNDRPQVGLDRDFERGMGITMGRLREDSILDWKFIALSHNTIRGAAGGAILTAELLAKEGYIKPK